LKKGVQTAICCPCGNEKILVLGLCATCYTLKRTCSRVSWYFRRVTVRHDRCSASGTKLRVSSFATSRFTKRSASGKSFLRPRVPRFDCACARWSVPDIGRASSRFWQGGFQYCSSAPQTGFQLVPQPAARSPIRPAIADAQGYHQIDAVQTGTRLGLQRRPLPQPTYFYARRFPLSYKA